MLLPKQSQQPVSPTTTFSTILFHRLSVEIKQWKVGEQTEPRKPSTTLSQVSEGQVTFIQTTPSGPHKWVNTADWRMRVKAVFAVEVASAQHAASIFLQKE